MGDGRWEMGGYWPSCRSRRLAYFAMLIGAHLLFPISHLRSQDVRIRQQRQELDRIRQERSDLERQMRELQNTAHDLKEELTNLDRRADATARIVRTLDRQLEAISTEVDDATNNMARAESELATKRVVLRHRLGDLYKHRPR